MSWRIRLLLIVDKFRDFLIGQKTFQNIPRLDSELGPSNISEIQHYLVGPDEDFVEVDRQLLGELLMTLAVVFKSHGGDINSSDIVSSLKIGNIERNDFVWEGKLFMDDIIDLSRAAEMDHVVDFLFGVEFDLHDNGCDSDGGS